MAKKPTNKTKATPEPIQDSAQDSESHPLSILRSQIDPLIDDFSTFPRARSLFDWAPVSAFGGSPGLTVPHVDVAENDKTFEVTADLPGVDQKDISVELKDDILTLSGEKKEEVEKKEKDYHLSERRLGSFKRLFRLPPGVDENKASADFKNGVLKIAFPKTPAAQKKNRKIEIRAG